MGIFSSDEESMWNDVFTLQDKIKRLQEENEELKKKNKEFLNLANNGGVLLIAESTKNKKYKQTLEEIKEISKQCMRKDLCSIDCDYADRCYIEDEEVPTYDICKFIIEKINEVLNDKE